MLTGNLVRVKTTSRGRIVQQYLDRDAPRWLEVAEGLPPDPIPRRNR